MVALFSSFTRAMLSRGYLHMEPEYFRYFPTLVIFNFMTLNLQILARNARPNSGKEKYTRVPVAALRTHVGIDIFYYSKTIRGFIARHGGRLSHFAWESKPPSRRRVDAELFKITAPSPPPMANPKKQGTGCDRLLPDYMSHEIWASPAPAHRALALVLPNSITA